MYSPTCETFLESVAEGHAGVTEAEASYVTETIRVEHDPEQVSSTDLRDALSTLGYTAYLREEAAGARSERTGSTRRSREMAGVRKRRADDVLGMRYAAGVLFGAFLMLPYVALLYPTHLAALLDVAFLAPFEGAFALDGTGGLFFLRVYFVLTGVVLFFTGMPVLRGAYVGLKVRRPNAELLVSITAVTAFVYSTIAVLVGRNDVYFDLTLVVAASVTGATFYESAVKQRALERLTDLTVSQVDTARLYESDGTTNEIPVGDVEPGDRVLVRRGERIPVDGKLAEGTCTVDEAVVTGESLPVEKRPGDDLVGGSIVASDAAVVRAGDGATSSLDRLRNAVWALQSADHGVQRRADRVAARVVPVVGCGAVIAGAGAVAVGSGPIASVLLLGTVVLVCCPWALGLATPLSVATSLEQALDHGLVVFDETVFERLRAVDVVVFDKTGTLTTGEMEVLEVDAPSNLLVAAAALERRASHPAAEAIVTAFAGNGATSDPVRAGSGTDEHTPGDGGVVRDAPEERRRRDDGGSAVRIDDFHSHPTGVEGVVDGTQVLVGAPTLFEELGWSIPDEIDAQTTAARGVGRLPVVVGRDGAAAGLIVVGDEPRDDWDDTLTRLDERGIEIVVLTGDDEEATELFGRHPHVEHAFAGVPPTGKTATIGRLAADRQVAMVGDGTNDAPALAAADLGISLGSATALAADAADIAIVDDHLGGVESAFDLASAARHRLAQNVGLALSFNAVAIPMAIAGLLNPLTVALAVLVSGGLLAANCSRGLLRY